MTYFRSFNSVLQIAACSFLALSATLIAQTPDPHPVVKLDPSLDSFISPDAQLEIVKRGPFNFTEGATWVQHGKDGHLMFVDIPGNKIYKLVPSTGELTVFADKAGYAGEITGVEMLTVGSIKDNQLDPKDPRYRRFSNMGPDGLAIDHEGRLIVCTYAGRSMVRYEKDGHITLLADRWDGKRFDGTNDIAIAKDDSIYFTDTISGMRDMEKDPAREMTSMGIYRIKDGKVTRVLHDLAYANGLAFSPDEKWLYANNTIKKNDISRFKVLPDGNIDQNGELLIDLDAEHKKEGRPEERGGTDGLRVDSAGNLWSTGPGGVWIISPEGKHLGTILVPEPVANLNFGDPDYKTLYLNARTTIYKIRLLVAGNVCPSCTPPDKQKK
jgi:gluconolactonase